MFSPKLFYYSPQKASRTLLQLIFQVQLSSENDTWTIHREEILRPTQVSSAIEIEEVLFDDQEK
jgi:hypothetical protein